ncbi:MAG: hypothetical protein V8S87_05615 [Oscillospiraceae bacterium]
MAVRLRQREQSAEIPAPVGDAGAAQTVNVEFTTDDGLIEISIHDDNADSHFHGDAGPAGAPKIITWDMAQQMAKGLFGEAELSEYSEELSESRCADIIATYEYAVTDESVKADHGAGTPPSWMRACATRGSRKWNVTATPMPMHGRRSRREPANGSSMQWSATQCAGFDYAGSDRYYTDAFQAGMSVDLHAVTEFGGVPYEVVGQQQ